MRRTRKSLTPDAPLAPVPSEILDQFVGQGPISHEELEAAVRRFKKGIIERALGGELAHHLAYPPGGAKPDDVTNHRNGRFADKILALYARGMTVRETNHQPPTANHPPLF